MDDIAYEYSFSEAVAYNAEIPLVEIQVHGLGVCSRIAKPKQIKYIYARLVSFLEILTVQKVMVRLRDRGRQFDSVLVSAGIQ